MSRNTTRQVRRDQFAAQLKEAQAQSGLSNDRLARQADIPLRSLQHWRAGTSSPSGEYLARLCNALDRPAEFFYPSENGNEAA